MRLILITVPRRVEGRLSRPRHWSNCAARAHNSVSQWFSWKTQNCLWQGLFLGSSRACNQIHLDHCDKVCDTKLKHRQTQSPITWRRDHRRSIIIIIRRYINIVLLLLLSVAVVAWKGHHLLLSPTTLVTAGFAGSTSARRNKYPSLKCQSMNEVEVSGCWPESRHCQCLTVECCTLRWCGPQRTRSQPPRPRMHSSVHTYQQLLHI